MAAIKLNTGQLTFPLRALGLIHLTDIIKFHFKRFRNRKVNKQFKKQNPEIVIPPEYMLFESYQLDYGKYYRDGKESALEFIELLSTYVEWEGKKILDWGCGPARVVRHLPALLPHSEIFASDYNQKTIEWCKMNIPDVRFSTNNLYPPLPFPESFFHVVHGYSIFTHLSEDNHTAWIKELYRITAHQGILYLTTHGEVYKDVLTKKEKEKFEHGELVVRAQAKEGHRVYGAFHPARYMDAAFQKHFSIVRHIAGRKRDWGLEQDTWILKKITGE